MSETLVPVASALPPIATSLTPGLPTAAELFDFAAGAERRFRTLRLRIEERTVTAAGEGLGSVELLIDRPHARVTTVHPQGGYEVWLTDGADVRGYNAVTSAVHETSLAGRVALTVEAAAPRAVALDGDRADFRFRVTFDRLTGVLLGVEEFRSAHLVRSALCTSFEVDASIPASAFDLELPPDVVTLY